MRTPDFAGRAVGWALSPLTSVVAAARRSRMFHPDGVLLSASVESVAANDLLRDLARRLEGHALVRLSSAWWKGDREWPDNLGCAVRFRSEPTLSIEPSSGDQDLLFATVRSPWTTLLAPLRTHVHDFLANDYYAVSPFEVDGFGRAKFRLVSSQARGAGDRRVERLLAAVKSTGALFTLECKLRGSAYAPVAKVRLIERVDLDQAQLRFDPFRDGRGIRPIGFVHKLRPGAYAGSQQTRFRVHQTSQSAV